VSRQPAGQDSFLGKYIPPDKPQAIAWVSCLRWALGNEDVLAQFRQDTGTRWVPGKGALDRMIDEATGADRAFIEAFAEWFNSNVWGEP